MAKKIKFNLICDGYPVSNLEELQEHFALEDILRYYQGNDKIFHRWLDMRGYYSELQKVMTINTVDPKQIAIELTNIFGIDVENDEIDRYFSAETFRKKKSVRSNEAAKKDLSFHTRIGACRLEYNTLINEMKSHDEEKSQNAIHKLMLGYGWAFKLNFPNLIEDLKSNENTGPILNLISILSKDPDFKSLIVDKDNVVKYELYKLFERAKNVRSANNYLPSWKVIEKKETRCLIVENYGHYHAVGEKPAYSLPGRIVDGLEVNGLEVIGSYSIKYIILK